jgi:hypothetical protein
MIIFDSKNKINEKLKEEKLRSAHLLRIKGYGSFNYICSCGEVHDVNGKGISCKGSSKPLKALLKCNNNFFTMIKIEGFFKKRAISEYGFDGRIFESE